MKNRLLFIDVVYIFFEIFKEFKKVKEQFDEAFWEISDKDFLNGTEQPEPIEVEIYGDIASEFISSLIEKEGSFDNSASLLVKTVKFHAAKHYKKSADFLDKAEARLDKLIDAIDNGKIKTFPSTGDWPSKMPEIKQVRLSKWCLKNNIPRPKELIPADESPVEKVLHSSNDITPSIQILSLKDWLTLDEAANYISASIKETINSNDLISLVKNKQLPLTIDIPEGTKIDPQLSDIKGYEDIPKEQINFNHRMIGDKMRLNWFDGKKKNEFLNKLTNLDNNSDRLLVPIDIVKKENAIKTHCSITFNEGYFNIPEGLKLEGYNGVLDGGITDSKVFGMVNIHYKGYKDDFGFFKKDIDNLINKLKPRKDSKSETSEQRISKTDRRINALSELVDDINRCINFNTDKLSQNAVFPFQTKIIKKWLKEKYPDLFDLTDTSMDKFFSTNSVRISKLVNIPVGQLSDNKKEDSKKILRIMNKNQLLKLL